MAKFQITVSTKIDSPSPVLQISAGDNHLIAVLTDKTLAVMGTNTSGQLGTGAIGTTLTSLTRVGVSDVAQIATGVSTSIVLHSDGTVTVFGLNSRGELGLGNKVNQLTPVKVPNLVNVSKVTANIMTTFVLLKDGTVKASGWHNFIGGSAYNSSTSFISLYGMSGILDIFAGGQSQFVKMIGQSAGLFLGWGGNNNGMLGDATFTERHTLTYSHFTQYPPHVSQAIPNTCTGN